MKFRYKHIFPFLNPVKNKWSRALSFLGLCLGITLLLCSVQMFININLLIQSKSPRKDGFDFISVTKTITNQNMGSDNRFATADVKEMSSQPFITEAAPLLSNQFRAKASAGSIIPFSTDLFLESIQDDFLDTLPPTFTWKPGQQSLPIIFSADFLEMYNVFAPAQGLPQLSESSIGAVNIIIECYGPLGQKLEFQGNIVALTNRINSVLVPKDFLEWANASLGTEATAAARVYIKTTDANSPELLSFLEQKGYHVNKDLTKFGRVKQVLQAVVAGLGGFSILVILLAMMLFSFYLQLMIARSKDNLQLLLTLGYSPTGLSKTVSGKWIPTYFYIIVISLAITQVLQYLFRAFYIAGQEKLSPFIHVYVLLLALILLLICIFINYRLIRKLLFSM